MSPPPTAPQIESPPFQISNVPTSAAFAPLVAGEQVVHARADHAGDHDRDDDRAELLGVASGARPARLGDLGRDEHADREHQPVRVQRERADVHDPVLRARDERDRSRADATTVQVEDGRRPMQLSMRGRIFAMRAGRRWSWSRVLASRLRPVPTRAVRAAADVAGPTVGGCPMFPANNPWNQKVTALAVRADSARLIANISVVGQDQPAPRLRRRRRVRHPVHGRAREPAEGARSTTRPTATRAIPGPFPIPANAPVEGGARATATGTCWWCSRERVTSTSSGARSGRATTGTPTSASTGT